LYKKNYDIPQSCNRLFYITVQNPQNLLESLLRARGVRPGEQAVFQVLVDELLGKRFQATPDRDDLSENFDTVPIRLEHALHALELSNDSPHAEPESLCLLLRVTVLFAGWVSGFHNCCKTA
jgi:hypothetical protein